MGDGKGTPWGPMEYGRPDAPQYETDFATDLGKYMTGPELAAAKEQLAVEGGENQRQYMAGQSKMLGSGTTSGSNAGALANIQALTQKNQNNAALQIGKEQMDAFNKAKMARNQLMSQKYGIDSQNYGQEQAGRGQAVGSLLGAGASMGGSYLGGLASRPRGK